MMHATLRAVHRYRGGRDSVRDHVLLLSMLTRETLWLYVFVCCVAARSASRLAISLLQNVQEFALQTTDHVLDMRRY